MQLALAMVSACPAALVAMWASQARGGAWWSARYLFTALLVAFTSKHVWPARSSNIFVYAITKCGFWPGGYLVARLAPIGGYDGTGT